MTGVARTEAYLREPWCVNARKAALNCSHYPSRSLLPGPSGCWCHCTAAGSPSCRSLWVRWCSWCPSRSEAHSTYGHRINNSVSIVQENLTSHNLPDRISVRTDFLKRSTNAQRHIIYCCRVTSPGVTWSNVLWYSFWQRWTSSDESQWASYPR